jgi:transposase
MTFVGFDLHKRYITACALDGSGGLLAEVRQLAMAIEAVADWLAALPAPVAVAMEATLYWEWLVGQLQQRGYEAQVAHAYQVKLIWQARSKTDPVDARKLAELLRTNLLPTIWVPDLETRRRRQLLRGRAFLVRERTRVKNRIHGHLTAENHRCPTTDLYGKAGRAWLASVPLSPVLQDQSERLLRLHDVLTQEIQRLDGQVKRAAHRDPGSGHSPLFRELCLGDVAHTWYSSPVISSCQRARCSLSAVPQPLGGARWFFVSVCGFCVCGARCTALSICKTAVSRLVLYASNEIDSK